jgi:hypothetical protein
MGSNRRPLSQWPDALARALLLIPQHPEVLAMAEPVLALDGSVDVDVTYRINLPQDWLDAGVSPSGVRSEEVVRFHFPSTYPLDAPVPSLRPDFDRSHPHILPHKQGDRPLPCIADLSLNSLLHQQGLRGILNQTAIWLDNAALGALIDRQQGWEPMRRDDLSHAITADASTLRGLVTRDGGHVYLPLFYAAMPIERGGTGVRGSLGAEPIKFNNTTIEQFVHARKSDGIEIGRSIALIVWPDKNADGTSFICDRYRPEDVRTFGDLLERARDYGCNRAITEQIEWLRRCVHGRQPPATAPLAFILCVRRPIHLIGSTSNIELLGYVAKYRDLVRKDWAEALIEPAVHNQQLGIELCHRLSGNNGTEAKWTLLGAGSLGSKIALHLTRQGMAPSHVVDNAMMRPHNAVRHGLLPEPEGMQALLMSPKARLLCESIGAFHQQAEPVQRDAIDALRTAESRRRIISKATTIIANSAASIRVREALANLTPHDMAARVIETALFANGRLGLVTVEGAGRQPNTGDLVTEFYRLTGATPLLKEQMFHGGHDLTRVSIGEGCGSATMVLSDSRVSAHAAAMAQMVTNELDGLSSSQSGRIAIGLVSNDGVSLNWSEHLMPPVKIVPVTRPAGWSVRLSEAVEEALVADIRRWPRVENGGILMGRLSEISRTFYVTDILPAPQDSRRSAALFELGVQGVRTALREYSERHGWTLYCLGTWHNHLGDSTPSVIDALTARAIALARVTPSLLLIKAPSGYSALVADAAKPL